MENMANRECCDVDIRDYYTNAPIMLIDFCNANTAEFSSDSITVRRNGVKFLRFDSPIESTISITFQVHPFYIYSMLNGNKIDDNLSVSRHETILATADGALNLTYPPIQGSIFVYTKGSDFENQIKGTLSGKIFVSDTIKRGVNYDVYYFEQKHYGVQNVTLKNTILPKSYHIQMLTTDKNEYSEIIPIRLIAYKAMPKLEMELSFNSDGDPMEVTLSFECFSDKNGNTISIAEVHDIESDMNIWVNFENALLETTSNNYYVKDGVLYYRDLNVV